MDASGYVERHRKEFMVSFDKMRDERAGALGWTEMYFFNHSLIILLTPSKPG
jgi:hypothetical protein